MMMVMKMMMIILIIFNYMELSPSLEAASCSPAEEFLKIFWNAKAHYCVYKSPSLVLMLSQINPVRTTLSYLSKIHLKIILSSTSLFFLLVSFLLAFPPKSYIHSIYLHACYMLCPSHLPWLEHSNYTWRRLQVMKLIIMQLSQISYHFIPLRSK
jgi:hypothetical protein